METTLQCPTSFNSLKSSSIGVIDGKSSITTYTEPAQAIETLHGIHKKTSALLESLAIERQLVVGSLVEKNEYTHIKNELIILSEKYNHILQYYLENTMILEPYLSDLIGELVDLISDEESALLVEQYFSYMFSIYTTIRIKSFIRNYGQSVDDIKKVVAIIEKFEINQLFEADIFDETYAFSVIRSDSRLIVLFGVVLILVCCVSIPFNLRQIHRHFCDWIQSIITSIALNPNKYGICHDILPWLFSRYLHRADTSQATRVYMVKWCVDSVEQWSRQPKKPQPQVFLLCLQTYFKNGDRASDLNKAYYTLQSVNFKLLTDKKSIKIKTAAYKLLQRLALLMLKPLQSQPINLRKPHVKDLMEIHDGHSENWLQKMLEFDEDSGEIPIEVDCIIELLLSGLGSENFKSRWSCAKGIGNVCERLDRMFVIDVVDNLKRLVGPYQSSECWQGACLAFGELARRCLITICQLKTIVETIKKALLYEERYASVGHGTFVRDAACYVCWTFARAFPPSEFNAYAEDLMGDVLCVALFDNELICRRAASAVIQELVGRMKSIPHGIELVTTCDYNNVKSLDYCYKTLAPNVYKFGPYQKAILNHLIDFRLEYWEINTRILASTALADLAADFPSIFISDLLEKLYMKFLSLNQSNSAQIHGVLLAYSNVVAQLSGKLDASIIRLQLNQIVDKVRNIMNECRANTKQLIQLSLVHFFAKMTYLEADYPNLFSQDYYRAVFEDVHLGLTSTHTPLVEKCIFFFEHVWRNRELCSNLLLSVMDDYLTTTLLPMVNSSRKRIRPLVEVLLYIPTVLTDKYFDKLYEFYLNLFHMDKKLINDDTDNIHAKALSIKLLYVLFSNVNPAKVTERVWNSFLNLLLTATQNYTVNKQGDVGLHVRMMAIEHIPRMVELLSDPPYEVDIGKPLMESLVGALLRQSAERVQKLRTAARCFFRDLILSENSGVIRQCSVIENYSEIVSSLAKNSDGWCSDSNAFIVNYLMLQYPAYASSSLLGIFAFVASPGCVDLESELVRNIFYHLEAASNCSVTIKNIVHGIVFIATNFSTHTRTRDSLIICLEPLISYKILIKATPEDKEMLTESLLNFLAQAVLSTQVVGRIKQIIDSLISVIDITESKAKKHECLHQICSLIAHAYPIVRMYAVEKLYVFVSVVDTDDLSTRDQLDRLTSLLLDTKWDQDVEVIRPKVLEIHNALSVFA